MADPVEEPRDEGELEKGRMPFLSHLVELRDRLRNAAMVFAVAFLVCWYFAKQVFDWLKEPLFDIWNQHCNALVVLSGISECFKWGTSGTSMLV